MEMIKNLREQSGAGIVDCKTALAEANKSAKFGTWDIKIPLNRCVPSPVSRAGKEK